MSQEAKRVYAEAVVLVERSLAEAARSQWAGQRPDLHRDRRALIELRRSVPNDRLEPCNQVVRDLLTAYAAVLDEQAARDSYEREVALSEEMKDELERLRPRAARQGLAVLTNDLRGFKAGRVAPPAPSSRGDAPRGGATRPASTPAPSPAADGAGQPRRRRRSRSSPSKP
jgi:hypothetical protein